MLGGGGFDGEIKKEKNLWISLFFIFPSTVEYISPAVSDIRERGRVFTTKVRPSPRVGSVDEEKGLWAIQIGMCLSLTLPGSYLLGFKVPWFLFHPFPPYPFRSFFFFFCVSAPVWPFIPLGRCWVRRKTYPDRVPPTSRPEDYPTVKSGFIITRIQEHHHTYRGRSLELTVMDSKTPSSNITVWYVPAGQSSLRSDIRKTSLA